MSTVFFNTWKKFSSEPITNKYFGLLIKEYPDASLLSFFQDGHAFEKHVEIPVNSLIDRVVGAPPILGDAKNFTSFDSKDSLCDSLFASLSHPRHSSEIIRWLVSDTTQREPSKSVDLIYGDTVGRGVRFEAEKLISFDCDELRLIIAREKSGSLPIINGENPFFFKVLTAYPLQGEGVSELNKEDNEFFASKLKEAAQQNSYYKIAWGLTLLGEDVIRLEKEGNGYKVSNEVDTHAIAKAASAIKIDDNQYIAVSKSAYGKQELLYCNFSTGRVYQLPKELETQFKEKIELLSAKFDFIWERGNFDCLVDNVVLDMNTIPETDNKIKLLKSGNIPPIFHNLDDLLDTLAIDDGINDSGPVNDGRLGINNDDLSL